jgi:autotransporter-associated beta strand protein
MKPSPTLRALLLAIASFPAHSATAAIITWSGGSGSSNDNWSTAENWDAGLPAGNDVVFAATDATGTTGPLGTVNNLVDANTTVTSLKYTNLETTGYHTTQIPSGVTLTVNGGGTNIEVQSPTTGTDDVVYATILGDGTLSANNTAATLYVSQGVLPTSAAGSATRRATLDLSGLGQFSAVLGQIVVGRQATTSLPNRAQGTLKLARNNTLDLRSNPGILIGQIASSNGTGQAQVLELGTTNTILSNNGITVGSRKGNGVLRFNSGTVATGAGSAIFRDNSGTGRQANWIIGDNSLQNSGSSGTAASGVVDFSLYGEVDALVGNIVLGNATAGTATVATFNQGTLTFDKGTIDTNSLTAGTQPTAAVPGNARGTVNVNGTAKLRVNGNLTLGRDIGEATYNAQGLINIGGGEVTISGNVICGGGSGNIITLTSGALTFGGTVGDDSVAGNTPLQTLQLNGGTLKFAFGSAPNPAGSRAKVTNLNVPNPVNLTFSGANLSPGTIELIKYTTFDEATQFANLNLALPDRIEATLVNNTANNSVDLDITGVFSNKWSGDVTGGDWDINSTQNWKLTPGNTPSTYLQSAVPGEPVTFDDSATGTKTVNLTTTLSPAAITVDTEQAYTFNGSGAISGPGGLTKRGSGSLVIGNSGTNDFTGSITIEAGKIQLSGGNDRLPANASVTLSDVAAAELDLNNLNQSLVSLNGGGTTGGNVNLGTGTLAITGASSFAGVISGSGSVAKSGSGTLTLSGANSYSGGTHFSGNGVLALAHSTAAGSGPIQFATTQTGTNGTFTLNGGIDVANPIVFDAATGRNTINSVGTLSNTLSGNITIINNSGNFVVINNAAPAGSATSFTVGGATPNSTTITAAEYSFSLSFRASQNGELGVLNSRIDAPNATFDTNNYGFWTINSTGNVWAVTSFVGSTTSAARIKLGADDALATGARISMGGTSPNSYLDLNGYNQTVAGLEGTNAASTIKNDSDTTDSVLTIAGLSADRNFVGGIVDGANGRKVSLVMNSSGFTQTLSGANTFSGNTTVGSGTLTLAAPNLANQSSTVTIAESGATLALNFNGSDTVGKLFIGTTQMDAGEYGAVGSAAPVIGIDQITGTGTLTVTSGPSSGGFASWQTANNATGGLDDDHDNDGVTNGIEYFIGGPGGNTTGFTPLPGVVNTAGTLSITWIKGSGYTGTYGTDFWVETSETLTGTWPPETLPGGNITDDPGFVKFTFPSPLGTKKFARLKVSGP